MAGSKGATIIMKNNLTRLATGLALAAAVAAPCIYISSAAVADDAKAAAESSKASKESKSSNKNPSAQLQASLAKALAFLKSQQKPGGAWHTGKEGPAITAIVLSAL